MQDAGFMSTGSLDREGGGGGQDNRVKCPEMYSYMTLLVGVCSTWEATALMDRNGDVYV